MFSAGVNIPPPQGWKAKIQTPPNFEEFISIALTCYNRSMLQINFYPESNNPNFDKAAREYSSIWRNEGNKIQSVIEKISGLKLKEKVINAVTCDDVSYSIPLKLQSNISIENKKGVLIHELCHRIIVGNNVRFDFSYEDKNWNLEVHKQVDLILYDIWVKLYDEEFARKQIDDEVNLWTGKGISPYKIAWDFTLSMTKEQRQKEFKKYLQ